MKASRSLHSISHPLRPDSSSSESSTSSTHLTLNTNERLAGNEELDRGDEETSAVTGITITASGSHPRTFGPTDHRDPFGSGLGDSPPKRQSNLFSSYSSSCGDLSIHYLRADNAPPDPPPSSPSMRQSFSWLNEISLPSPSQIWANLSSYNPFTRRRSSLLNRQQSTPTPNVDPSNPNNMRNGDFKANFTNHHHHPSPYGGSSSANSSPARRFSLKPTTETDSKDHSADGGGKSLAQLINGTLINKSGKTGGGGGEYIELMTRFGHVLVDKSEQGVGHSFKPYMDTNPTFCDSCGDLIWLPGGISAPTTPAHSKPSAASHKSAVTSSSSRSDFADSSQPQIHTVQCDDCKYVCHARCERLVRVNCRGASAKIAKARGQASPLAKATLSPSDNHRSLSPLISDVKDATDSSSKRSELEKKIAIYNSHLPKGKGSGLGMMLQDDGVTFRGFLRVYLNLTRPINVIAGQRPPSIYDILKADEEEGLRKVTLTSFYMPRDTVKNIHITSNSTSLDVIKAMLKKFKVVDNPAKFALYIRYWVEQDPNSSSSSSSNTDDKSLNSSQNSSAALLTSSPINRSISSTSSGSPSNSKKQVLKRIPDQECPLRLLLEWTSSSSASSQSSSPTTHSTPLRPNGSSSASSFSNNNESSEAIKRQSSNCPLDSSAHRVGEEEEKKGPSGGNETHLAETATGNEAQRLGSRTPNNKFDSPTSPQSDAINANGNGNLNLNHEVPLPAGSVIRREFVLQENDTGDILWEAFALPELSNFLKILDREETEYTEQITDKFLLIKRVLARLIKEKEDYVSVTSNEDQAYY